MEPDFWHERWENNLIGFHLDEVHPHLREHWDSLAVKPGGRVLVPLSGKSLDLIWLAEQGYEVIGVEISPVAVKNFFAENHLRTQRIANARCDTWKSASITLLCGDLFELTAGDIGPIDAVYDRASLIALPPAMRRAYVETLDQLVPTVAPHLLITLDYDPARMDGPPFAVSEAEIQALYSERYQIDCLQTDDALARNERFKKRGLDWLRESVYRLTPL
ncbi:thiopurine S-methyltransferase [Thiohalophilus thiocyanatoxydans]|uniref:Thiopurine S-methyltransferase n=1 Tax=Thiohalophilus thiocyanatoxydans TaxID=381308 RepID=A0A4R8IJV7_9GAMM|nr:thiopurine S-methyltransferase [Thiohalophilus thiocyanatoxydans]TDY01016.1 thiopurine S-methyltransferase [Thiohalophilus thiocyanatoxydans]